MKKRSTAVAVLSILLFTFCILPFAYILVRSVFDAAGNFTLLYFYQVFLSKSQYLFRFWRSLGLSICIATGQVFVSVLAGYGLAKSRFLGRNFLLFLLIMWMVIPLQVTLVPNYLILDNLGLMDTYYALILPMVFVPLGTFIMTQSFRSIPEEILEAAQLDGAGTLSTLTRVATPMGKSGLICTMLLSFLDGWNMVEQPITFLKNFSDFPLSVALATTPPEDPNVQLLCCILAAIPPITLFVLFNRDMTEGIELGGGKAV